MLTHPGKHFLSFGEVKEDSNHCAEWRRVRIARSAIRRLRGNFLSSHCNLWNYANLPHASRIPLLHPGKHFLSFGEVKEVYNHCATSIISLIKTPIRVPLALFNLYPLQLFPQNYQALRGEAYIFLFS